MKNAFISCDWGTTSFRLRFIKQDSSELLYEHTSRQGIRDLFEGLEDPTAQVRDKAFSAALGSALDTLIAAEPDAAGCQVVLSGMASSSIGWRELPYAALPFSLDGSNIRSETIPLETPNGTVTSVVLISGLASSTEIMRGEETELIGIGSMDEARALTQDCQIVLPGTHSKHVVVKNHEITEFSTLMTGELFDCLTKHTILSATTAAANDGSPIDREAFAEGVEAASSRGLEESLFQARTRSILGGKAPGQNREFLSGLLIGSELMHLSRVNKELPILFAAGEKFRERYHAAASQLDLMDHAVFLPPEQIAKAAIRGHKVVLEKTTIFQ